MLAKDLKNSGRKPEKKPAQKFPIKLLVIAVIMLGGFVYGLYYLSQKPIPPVKVKSVPISKKKSTQLKPKKDQPKVIVKENERPRFEFYTILPEMEVVIPEEELVDDSKIDKKTQVKQVSKEKFVQNKLLLQAGSFKSYNDADKLKAKLALIGLEAGIQSVYIGKDKWHRVRIGPFKTLDEINETRVRLAENSIQTIIIKYQK